jgi:Protein of unknown function (DUF4238)
VSSKKKNQHFVPRHYLKRFSFDGGSRIKLFNLTNQLYVSKANLKNQCSSSYFYGKDSTIEDALSAIEGRAEALFRQICERKDIPESKAERNELLIAMTLMHLRTERAVAPLNEIFELTLKNSMRLEYKMTGKELPDGLDLIKIKDRAMPTRNVVSFLHRYQIVLDLELRLVLAPKAKSFITSDHPVVLLNQSFFDIIKSPAINGLASRGLQLLLPLSPELLLIAFDRDLYRVGNPSRNVVRLGRDEDCDLINALQIINAEQNIYFGAATDDQYVRSLLAKFAHARERARKSEKAISQSGNDGESAIYVIGGGLRVPVPGKWSFCKARKAVTRRDFGLRIPELSSLFEEHANEMRRTGRRIPFKDWMVERDVKADLQKKRRSTSLNRHTPPD